MGHAGTAGRGPGTPSLSARRLLAAVAGSLLCSVACSVGTAGASAGAVGTAGAAAASGKATGAAPGYWDWPTYGHDAQHTFAGRTTLTKSSVTHLAQAWFFPTGDAVTATPTEVGGTVYFGSWDTRFYAVSLATGKLEWRFQLDQQHAVTPYPGESPRDSTSDGGLVTSSAWFEPGDGHRPDLVIFGGGYTLYALNAHTGALYWKHAYTGMPWLPPQPDTDGARIFSSPVVFGHKVLFGLSVDGERGERGYVVAASLATGKPVWEYQTDVSPSGQVLDDGCGNIWSSGTVLPRAGLVVFSEADCHFSNPPPTAESVFALRVSDGSLVWRFRPHRPDNKCDWDFGATPNAGIRADGTTTFLGMGSKDGTYYSLHPLTGRLRWKTNVVFGGSAGGFIATAAYDGTEVVGSTALGDLGRFESTGPKVCEPGNPRDTPFQEPTVHAFAASDGSVLWQASHAASFAPTTIANRMSFNGLALSPSVQVRTATTGHLLDTITLPTPSWSGIATVGNAILFGTGTSAVGSPAGVYAFTPGGVASRIPPGHPVAPKPHAPPHR